MRAFLMVSVMACFILSACGVKPGAVEAPEESDFPRTYPAPENDEQSTSPRGKVSSQAPVVIQSPRTSGRSMTGY